MNDWKASRVAHLFVLSGPSGVGKDTVIHGLLKRVPELHYVVTVTTRPPRPGEIDGTSYHFVSESEYSDMLQRQELLAPANVHGHLYGAPIQAIVPKLKTGRDVLLKVDVQGALAVRRRIPQAVLIFLAPASTDDLIHRLRTRHTESRDELDRRLRDAGDEMKRVPNYDYVIENADDGQTRAINTFCCIITAERSRVHHSCEDATFR